MSASPTNETDYAAAFDEFKRGGWIVSLLGGAGMLARLLLDDDNHPAMFWIRRFLAGTIVGCLCYFALYGQDIDGLKKAIILSTAGAGSPELMERVIKGYGKGNNAKKNAKPRKRNRKA